MLILKLIVYFPEWHKLDLIDIRETTTQTRLNFSNRNYKSLGTRIIKNLKCSIKMHRYCK